MAGRMRERQEHYLSFGRDPLPPAALRKNLQAPRAGAARTLTGVLAYSTPIESGRELER
jgi:hypothetical protein